MIMNLTTMTTIGTIRMIIIVMTTKAISIKLTTMTRIGTIKMIRIMMTRKKLSRKCQY